MKKLYFSLFLFVFATLISAQTTQIPHTPDYAGGNGTIIEETEDDVYKTTARKHYQTVKIGDMARDERRIIYSNMEKSAKIYELKDNDELEISEIWNIMTKNDGLYHIWLKVKTNDYSGFLCYSEPYYNKYHKEYRNNLPDPYENDAWEIIETISSGNKKWTVRKMTQGLSVFASTDEIELHDKPGETGTKVIGYVPTSYKKGNGQINVETEALTDDAKWARITFEGKTGWINGLYLSAERGGPKYYIPEDVLNFNLGWY